MYEDKEDEFSQVNERIDALVECIRNLIEAISALSDASKTHSNQVIAITKVIRDKLQRGFIPPDM